MEKDAMKQTIEKHQLWMDGKEGGERAILTDANLTGANLTDALLDT